MVDDLFSLASCQDPYSRYAELLAGPPVVPSPIGGWLAVHHAAVLDSLRMPALGHVEVVDAPAGETLGRRLQRLSFIMRNPPDHTVLRGLVARRFAPRAVRAMRPDVERLVDTLLDELADRGSRADLLEVVAGPLPVTVIADLLAIPEADRARFRAWSEAMVLPEGSISDAQQQGFADASEAFGQYLRWLLERRRAEPGDDLVTELAAAAAEQGLEDDEVLAVCLLLLFAGHETTVNLIGNGVLALLRHPAERARLVADPDGLAVPAVEELLRYDGPVHLTARDALEPVELHGVHLEPGERVVVMLGAANRDSRRFADPPADVLDLTRRDNGHVGFGFGIHFCLGAPLARLEAQIVIPELLRRFPTLEVDGDLADLTWRHSLMLRGLDALPVTW